MIVKNGLRLCGTGGARASTAIQQNKAYWEVKVQQGGVWSAGVATPSVDLNKDLGLDHCSWAITAGGVVRTRGQQVGWHRNFLVLTRVKCNFIDHCI